MIILLMIFAAISYILINKKKNKIYIIFLLVSSIICFYSGISSAAILFIILLIYMSNFKKTEYDINDINIDRSKAAEILGISKDANKQEIKKAYYQLMQKFHPDKGGNSYIANQITTAYKILIK